MIRPLHARLADIVLDACTQDIRAFKPGNVAVGAPGHGMDAEDFLRSARAAAPILCRPDTAVGVRIADAVEATWQVVSCNTNLGILLLLAPLIAAAEHVSQSSAPLALRQSLLQVLDSLDVADATACYRAIRQARPGGLGAVPEHDVAEAPRITLREAMAAAAGHDAIAREYSEGYRRIFETGLPVLTESAARGEPELWAVTRCYLTFLAEAPDTHVVRRQGAEVAARVREDAAALLARWPIAGAVPWPELRTLDRQWKAAGTNPGTTADLTVATLSVMRLQQAQGYNADRHAPDASTFVGATGVDRFRKESVGNSPRTLDRIEI